MRRGNAGPDGSWRAVLWLMLLVLVAACSDSATGPGPVPDPGPDPDPDPTTDPVVADVDSFVATLGTWDEFAPPIASSNAATAPDSVYESVVQEPDSAGIPTDVTYVCTGTPYSLAETPEEIVMYEPNASIMWVGNLIQGDSYKGGQGSFEELSIRQRAPLKLSIDLLTGDNSATVADPSLTSVQSAIGELIQRAHDNGHRSGSSIDYQEQLTYSVEQAALSLGLSARFLGASATAELDVQRQANERTLVAHFVQKMFTIAIELPQTPDAMFSDEFTAALLQQQIDAGNIGRTNLPVYIASVTYGRTLTYSLTSTHSESRMRAAIAASYDGLAGGASGYTEAELRETLGQQNIHVTAIGGEGQNVLDLISSGDLKSYFTTDAALTSAKPLSYQLNFLGDNSIAKVGETTEYTLTTCEQKVMSPGRLEFLAVQQGASPVPTPYRVVSGDFNGDGRGDIVWNHVVSGANHVAIGFGQADGTFDVRTAVQNPVNAGSWSDLHTLHVADVTGDGSDDLLWNRLGGRGPNTLYLAVSNGDGTFDFRDGVVHPNEPSWADEWNAHVGDLDDDGDADIIWNYLEQQNFLFTALSNGDGSYQFSAKITHPAGGWTPYTAHVADANGDRRADLIWTALDANGNRTYVALSLSDGTFDLLPYQDKSPGSDWTGYTAHIGDIDRNGIDDLIWVGYGTDQAAIHRGIGQASGAFALAPRAQLVPTLEGAGPLTTHLGDFNDDGSADILWNDLSATRNHVRIGLGNEAGTFDFTPIDQEHPATDNSSVDWTAFQNGVLVLDIDNDNIDDVVWIDRSGTYRIYVALGRDPGV